jgi:ATP-dependent protease HslVU (ClpYQ) ATPase subunit
VKETLTPCHRQNQYFADGQHQEEIEQLRQQHQEEKDLLRQQLQDEKDKNTKLEMQLNEMSKMTASVAGKASHEELLKALRVFVNKSKRKKLEKRIAVKEMVLELANANSLMLPEDLSSTIDSLDDLEKLLGGLSAAQLAAMRKNVDRVSKQLADGHYLRTAIENALDELCSEGE